VRVAPSALAMRSMLVSVTFLSPRSTDPT
jgi:hypothetical protein